jgi:hypothetical protein
MRLKIVHGLPVSLAGLLLLSACTYVHTKERLARTEVELVEAKAELENAEDQKLSLERDRQRTAEQQQSARIELEKMDQAHRKNKVSRERYDELRRQLDQLRFEEDAARLSTAPDAEKQQKLAALQKRKQALIEAIRTLGSS